MPRINFQQQLAALKDKLLAMAAPGGINKQPHPLFGDGLVEESVDPAAGDLAGHSARHPGGSLR